MERRLGFYVLSIAAAAFGSGCGDAPQNEHIDDTRGAVAPSSTPLALRDVTGAVRSAALTRTEYFQVQSGGTWQNNREVFLIGATGSTHDYPGRSFDGYLTVGHTFGTKASSAFSVDLTYVDPAGQSRKKKAFFPAFDTSASGLKMMFYVAEDGSTYYADPQHDGYAQHNELLSPAQALVPVHLARERGISFDSVSGLETATNDSIVVADFDGDGHDDVASLSSRYRFVDVYFGDGTGALTHGSELWIGQYYARSLGAADWNGDGVVDLVITIPGSPSVFTSLGVGDGTFLPIVGHGAPYWANSTTAADIDGDGKLDLVVATDAGARMLKGSGNGTFGPATTITTSYAYDAASGDFNGDGATDVAVASGTDGVTVLLGSGLGTLTLPQSFATSGFSQIVRAGDVDGDGDLDLVDASGAVGVLDGGVVTHYPAGISLLLGNGDGSFDAAVTLASVDARALSLEDLDGDGALDLVAASEAGGQAFRGRGDGTFGDPEKFESAEEGPFSLAVGNFGGSAARDVAAGHWSPYVTGDIAVHVQR